MKRLEAASSIAVLLVAILAGYYLIKDHLPVRVTSDALVGKSIDPKTASLSPDRPTLVLAISSQCHFCLESEPFYRKITATPNTSRKADIVALLPQSATDAETFLAKNEIKVDRIVSTNLVPLGIEGTPTVLLVDPRGKIIKSWTGKLDVTREQQVLSSLT